MSDYLDPHNEELLKDFFDEAHLQVDMFEQNILALEKDATDRDAIDEMFRAAHTLKGAAATVQMPELTAFTHAVEDALDEVRSGNATATTQVVEALLQSIDVIKEMLLARSGGVTYDDDPSRLIATLREVTGIADEQPPASPAKQAETETAPASIKRSAKALSEYDVLEFQDAASEGETVYAVTVEFDESNPMNTVGGIQVFAALKEVGTVIRTDPDFEDLYEDVFYPTVVYYTASVESPDTIRKKVNITDVTISADIAAIDLNTDRSSTDEEGSGEESDTASTEEPVEQTTAEGAVDSEEDPPQPQTAKKTSAMASGGSILRVDSKRIDMLLNLVSEAVINKASFSQITQAFADTEDEISKAEMSFKERLRELLDAIPALANDIASGTSPATVRNDLMESYADLAESFKEVSVLFKSSYNHFRNTAQNLGRITGELQEGVMQIRMVPISQIFSRFPRLVRDVSKSLGKQLELEIEGQDTELDKSVIEDLLDPLIHCVRNAVDHGVEMPEDRKAAGKDETGTVSLKASNEGNLIAIEISDDGKGIDVASVRQKAIDRGLIHPSKQLSDVEAFNMIFEPGFSTAPKITDISGRGVGLDVVKKQIEKLNGSVSVWSEPGNGTRITIKLPLTLAIIQGLLIRVGPEIYAIPITSVLESQRIRPDEIKLIDNYQVMSIRDEVVSLLRMDTLFGVTTDDRRTHHYVVIVGSEEKKVGLVVDSLIGEEDVVIKPLKDRFTNTPGIAGATILGDGSVALIIDVGQLLELGMTRSTEELQRRAQAIV